MKRDLDGIKLTFECFHFHMRWTVPVLLPNLFHCWFFFFKLLQEATGITLSFFQLQTPDNPSGQHGGLPSLWEFQTTPYSFHPFRSLSSFKMVQMTICILIEKRTSALNYTLIYIQTTTGEECYGYSLSGKSPPFSIKKEAL